MGVISDQIATVFRDFVTAGVASSGIYDPPKSDIRAIGPVIEASIANAALGALVDLTKDTKANLDLDLAHAADTVALVYADGTDANNDLYIKAGASGSGSWTNTGALHAIVDLLISPYVDPVLAAAAVVHQGFELILQPDDGVTEGAWYADYFRPVTTEFTDLDFVLLGGGTCDISLNVNDFYVAGPFAVTAIAGSETTAITVAAGSRISVVVTNITGSPIALVVQWKGLPA